MMLQISGPIQMSTGAGSHSLGCSFTQTSCGTCCSALTFMSCIAETGAITAQPRHIFQNAIICSSGDK